jgi:hypothetical protein
LSRNTLFKGLHRQPNSITQKRKKSQFREHREKS